MHLSLLRAYTPDELLVMSHREAWNLFVRMRWLGEPHCPHCGTTHPRLHTARAWQFQCRRRRCNASFSVTSSTVFADHRMPLNELAHDLLLLLDRGDKSVNYIAKTESCVSEKPLYLLAKKIKEAQAGLTVSKVKHMWHPKKTREYKRRA